MRRERPEIIARTITLTFACAVLSPAVDGPSSAGLIDTQRAAGTDTLDVKLGMLSNIQQVTFAHIGTHPDGRTGLSMSTTSCNVGNVNVPWHRPMNEDHPFIAFQLYREMDGRFEQIGVSWVKHAFFALSDNACTPCEKPTSGNELGVGCSDTYTNGNNSHQFYLGPREEIDPYAGTWSCLGSYFAGEQPDCVDRRNDLEYDVVDHRLEVRDYDLEIPGARYFYEAMYVVAGDEDKMNNVGSRECTMSWSGSSWVFSTPAQDNDLMEGPALQRWGEMSAWTDIGTTDGRVLLAVETTDLGEGLWRYEYGLYNFDSARRIRSMSLPTGKGTPSSMTFHDWDDEPANDWAVTLSPGSVTWATEPYEMNPDANALTFGLLFSFGFTQGSPPVDATGVLSVFEPPAPPARGEPATVTISTRAPDEAVPVLPGSSEPGVAPPAARIGAPAPNPTGSGTVVPLTLEAPARVTLAVFDAGGRRVRALIDDRPLGTGVHRAAWDGTDAAGARAAAGVYFLRFAADGRRIGGRSVVVTR